MTGLNKFIDQNLLPHLLLSKMSKAQRNYNDWLYAALVFCLVVALANPRWSYHDHDAFQPTASMVVLLDLSASMNATDVSPSRIGRARQYIEDLLNLSKGLKIGLIGYAGYPHLISPISDDIQTIKTYIPALDTDLSNVQGNSLHTSLRMAAELLAHEPGEQKSILLLSDGNVATNDFSRELSALTSQNIHVHVVGIGTKAGAPYKNKNGSLHKASGKIVNSTLNDTALKEIAKQGHGIYTEAGLNDLGLRTILSKASHTQEDHVVAGKVRQWEDRYYLFLIPAAFIMLYLMRSRAIYVVFVAVLANGALYNDVYAIGIKDVFMNSGQRGQQIYTEGDFTKAAETFSDPYHKGVALYRGGQYAEAEEQFNKSQRATVMLDAMYNAGNAQMQQSKWRAAINSYESVLKIEPDHFAAQHNLEIARKMLEENKDQDKDDNCECNNKDKSKQSKNDQQNGKDGKDQAKNEQQDQQDQQQNKQDKQKQDMDNQDSDAKQNESEQKQSQKQDLQDAQQQADNNDKGQDPKDKAAQAAQMQQLAEDEARVEQWLNRIDSDIKIFLKNKFYVEDVLSAQ
ncbi:MAG TPA: VWA domain-containing protein [Gammaproteobacteria bacterium]|nr:VWA domain-containing protein [Gammaproteobacteria bacterium]